ncbi:MAG: response regulator transcription factor [Acidobacteria bacterium]|nr:response regulator transcription factor [Acidobacteriota bacterium]
MLIADGDATLRRRLYAALLEADIFSDCVSTTVDAMEHLHDRPYAVIVVDIGLPGGDIDRVVDSIGAIAQHQRPVVLVLAANAEAARTLDVEIVQIVLRKPVHLRQLVELIRSCIRGVDTRLAEPPEKGNGNGDHLTS